MLVGGDDVFVENASLSYRETFIQNLEILTCRRIIEENHNDEILQLVEKPTYCNSRRYLATSSPTQVNMCLLLFGCELDMIMKTLVWELDSLLITVSRRHHILKEAFLLHLFCLWDRHVLRVVGCSRKRKDLLTVIWQREPPWVKYLF